MTFQSLQHSVGQWHLSTFGPACSSKRIARKLLEEAAEFMVERTPEEAADVLLVLLAWAHREGIDLVQCAANKFEIVKNRDQAQRDE